MKKEDFTEDPIEDIQPTAEEKHFRLSNGQILLIVLIILGIQMMVDFSQRIVDGQRKFAELRRLEAEVALQEAESRQLELEKTYYSSPSYVDYWAHTEGKMIQQGEMLVIPVYDSNAAADAVEIPIFTDSTEVETAEFPPFYYWWTLFFESPRPFS